MEIDGRTGMDMLKDALRALDDIRTRLEVIGDEADNTSSMVEGLCDELKQVESDVRKIKSLAGYGDG